MTMITINKNYTSNYEHVLLNQCTIIAIIANFIQSYFTVANEEILLSLCFFTCFYFRDYTCMSYKKFQFSDSVLKSTMKSANYLYILVFARINDKMTYKKNNIGIINFFFRKSRVHSAVYSYKSCCLSFFFVSLLLIFPQPDSENYDKKLLRYMHMILKVEKKLLTIPKLI